MNLLHTVLAIALAASLDPGALSRGPDPVSPIVNTRTNELRYDGRSVELDLSGPAYSVDRLPRGRVLVWAGGVLASYNRDGSRHRVVMHEPTRFELSADRHRLAFARQREGRTTVFVKNATTGRLIARRTFPGHVDVGALGDRVFLTQSFRDRLRHPRTLRWNPETGQVRVFARGWSVWAGDVSAGRIVLHREDLDAHPYPGCIRVVRPGDARDVLWRSCTWGPLQWSPDGRYALAYGIGTDGYASTILRIIDGRTGSHVRTFEGIFLSHGWEDDDSVLAVVQNDESDTSAVVRLNLDGSAERVTALYDPTPYESANVPWTIENNY